MKTEQEILEKFESILNEFDDDGCLDVMMILWRNEP